MLKPAANILENSKKNKLAPFAALILGIISNTGFAQLDSIYDSNNPLSPLNPNHPIHHPEQFNKQPSANNDINTQKNNWMLIFFWGITLFLAGWFIYSVACDKRTR